MSVEYTLKRASRRSIALIVEQNGEVVVRAPKRVSAAEIEHFISQKRNWLTSTMEKQKRRNAALPVRNYQPGDSYLLLGEQVSLQVDSRQECIDWYTKQAQRIVSDATAEFTRHMGCSYNAIRISKAKRQLGSCTSKGTLSFSYRLVMAPELVVHYVVVHELAHLDQMNHSAKFWRRVGEAYPHFRDARIWLRKNNHLLQI